MGQENCCCSWGPFLLLDDVLVPNDRPKVVMGIVVLSSASSLVPKLSFSGARRSTVDWASAVLYALLIQCRSRGPI